ncbi:aldo/keto reductase [Streptomyces avermitilis]|uniref:aldo/keto reductase n=1 Tax=Streptomyces avermitilis TaxID=33903 RepID=UPI0033B866AD
MRSPLVSAPIVGATKPHHLQQAVDAIDLQLTDEEAATLEKPYVNAGPSWF